MHLQAAGRCAWRCAVWKASVARQEPPADISPPPDEQPPLLPVEVEVYINPDGTVTFADLEEKVLPVARSLNPDDPLVCSLPGETPPVPDTEEQPPDDSPDAVPPSRPG